MPRCLSLRLAMLAVKQGEEACAENNQSLFDYHIPTANEPDF